LLKKDDLVIIVLYKELFVVFSVI